jgi:uncharacterized protein YbbC (DUF1343 family)
MRHSFFVPSQICGFAGKNRQTLSNTTCLFIIKMKLFIQLSIIACSLSCAVSGQKSNYRPPAVVMANKKGIITGADQTNLYVTYLQGKNIGMVINQTSVIGKNKTLSVDSLIKLGIAIKKIYGPEHGFRGDASNGADVNNSIDTKTGLPVISIYGNKHFKPTPDDLKGIDLIIYDIQDVGARFYTYLSTLQYVMEACAENNIELMILDRPNPNGFYVDGPILDTAYPHTNSSRSYYSRICPNAER